MSIFYFISWDILLVSCHSLPIANKIHNILFQIPRNKGFSPQKDDFGPQTGTSYLKIQTVIPEAFFQGSLIFKYRLLQPFRYRDERRLQHLLFISQPDSFSNILSLDFYLFPSQRGYLLRLDLRPAEDFYRRISPGTAANRNCQHSE